RTLIIRPDTSSTVGSFTADLISFNFSDNVNLFIDTTAPAADASISLLNDTRINFARSVNLLAGTGAVTMNSLSADPMAESGNVTVTAGAFQSTEATFLVRSELGDVTFNAPIELSAAAFGIRAEQGTLRVNGPVNGENDLTLYGGDVIIDAPVGATTPLATLTFAGGNVSFGTNPITAAAVLVGDGNFDPLDAAFGLGTGLVTADVTVQSDGDLAPGGVGVAGNMFIVGNLTFDGGDFAPDLGLAWDKVDVTGDVTINFGRLGSEVSTGALTNSADRQIISLTGTLTGEYFNAPLDFPLAVGADAVRVTNYSSAPTGVTIAQMPGAT